MKKLAVFIIMLTVTAFALAAGESDVIVRA